ncbi:NADP-dependent oxidoreductase [Beggiatoa leptomitoformis]|uniref:Zinc-binding dehydrogenase n=1 Tax=Beggiatoa leptomitoformis TaxID=288004 RepID=A0A2N9YJM1_9GAMM|nr:NADP-dependent oxidoreductase [Beggiatoa leptomitoformis]ALG69408.2 zinc-binding dehydrogenase [Beggiatoa leptomitoformis]AUI70664.2 zinc-binding dehydrogenase [Beggiatoa leptomitoformis]
MNHKMHAVIIQNFGGREQLKYVELPKPAINEGEVLIQIKAAGVNPVDWKIREGWLREFIPHHFPLILGWEMAGVVAELGYSARRFKVGDEVYAYCRRPCVKQGTYAEYISLPESYLSYRPKNLTFEESAGVPLAALTAYQAIYSTAHLQEGQRLLVIGASGGVGSFAVQYGKLIGAQVIGVASGRHRHYLKQLGIEQVLDYTETPNFATRLHECLPDGVDVVFDCVGGGALYAGQTCVKKGGVLVSIVEQLPEEQKYPFDFHYVFVEPNVMQLEHICQLFEQEQLQIHIDAVYPLADVAKAHEVSELLHTRGKIVLRV